MTTGNVVECTTASRDKSRSRPCTLAGHRPMRAAGGCPHACPFQAFATTGRLRLLHRPRWLCARSHSSDLRHPPSVGAVIAGAASAARAAASTLATAVAAVRAAARAMTVRAMRPAQVQLSIRDPRMYQRPSRLPEMYVVRLPNPSHYGVCVESSGRCSIKLRPYPLLKLKSRTTSVHASEEAERV